MLVRFLKNWTLPLAMLSGTLGYFILANVPFLAPTKPYINDLIAFHPDYIVDKAEEIIESVLKD